MREGISEREREVIVMNEKEKDATERWLKGFHWDFWTTPTFKFPKTQTQAVAAVTQWLVSKPGAYAVVAYERGPLGGRLHCHAMIGGVGRSPLAQTRLSKTWRKGIIDVKPYDATKRCIRYLLKFAGDSDGLEVIGNPATKARPQKKRSKR